LDFVFVSFRFFSFLSLPVPDFDSVIVFFAVFYFIINTSTLIVGFTLTTSSDNATVGLDLTFTCVTTETLITFTKGNDNVCYIIGSNASGTCVFDGSYIQDYTYTCNPTNNVYTVTIPGSYLTESLHRTKWQCQSLFGGGTSHIKILYVNGELLYVFRGFEYLILLLYSIKIHK
jgi:hypothetical protein